MEFTHFDKEGNAAMVDVSGKDVTQRMAVAEGVARIAGIMGAKKTSELIPLCHNLNLTKVAVDFEKEPDRRRIRAVCTARCTGRTGVEMEALTGVTAALLTVYDMCKAVDRSMEISDIHLVHKEGGKSGIYDRQKQEETE